MSGIDVTRRNFIGAAIAGAAGLGMTATGRAATEDKGEAARNPNVYRFRIGEAEAFSISDCAIGLREGLGLMWPEEARPEMKREMERRGERTDELPLYVNVLVVRAGKEVAVFDAGFGRGDNPNMGWFMAGLESAGIRADEVTAGFISHAHADHLNGFLDHGRPAFPNAKIYLLEEELAFWRSPEPDFSKTKRDQGQIPGMIREVRRNFDLLQPQLQPVRHGAVVLGGLVTVESAPGHTDGHACFRIQSGEAELLHLADLSHHHLLMFADPEWTIAFDHDPETAVVSRKKYWREAAEARTRCYGFHLPWPGLGNIISQEGAYQWWPERWRWA